MKAEDVEVGKTYVMLEDEKSLKEILIKRENNVKVLEKYKNVCVVQDLEKDKNGNGKWVVEYQNMGETTENVEQEKPLLEKLDKYEQHRQLCEKIHSTYVAKNKDYGDSFTRTRKEAKYPELVIVTRLSDKFYRLKTLLEGAEQQVKSESIDDTLLDMANYCLMEIIERQNGKEVNI